MQDTNNVYKLFILMFKMNDLEIVPGCLIGLDHPCFIIAEIGQNHQGDFDTAKKLIKIAKDCGADCVKFQKTDLNEKFTQSMLDSPYANSNSWGSTYGEHKRFIEFSNKEFYNLKYYAENEVGIAFTSSAMDPVSLKMLCSLEVPFIKIGSGDADNVPLLKDAVETNKTLVISTGMQNMDSVTNIYKTVTAAHKKLVLLHCVSSYPTNPEDINLRLIQCYKERFPDIHIGYSGHEVGTAISIAAVTLGAKVIERHITLNKSQKGTDHCCSLEPAEFCSLISDIRCVERALGNQRKIVQRCEESCYKKLYKTVVANRDLSVGDVISKDDIKVKVSLTKGISPKFYYNLIGRKILKNVSQDEEISSLCVENHLQ